jgi:hypothetical protein
MAKQIASINSKPGAWIVSPTDKGRKSIKNGKCFLENNETFEIELFNPLTVSVLADIKLNGQSISKTGLVVKPGQRVYLDCFIDDRKKFKFSTYEIETSLDAINATVNNGVLEVFFYKEDVITLDNWQRRFDRIIVEKYYPYNPYPWYNPYQVYYGTNIGTEVLGTISGTTTNNIYSSNLNCSYTSSDIDLSNLNLNGSLSNNMIPINSIETGRVEKGEKSKQKFTEVEMDFEKNYISSTIIQILPESRKPVETKDIFNKKTGEINFKNDPTKNKKLGTSGEWPHQYETNTDGVIELIKKLADLHSAGILTDDEFSEKKTELLSKI